MEFSSFFFHLLFFSQVLQFSNTIVSSAKVQIPEQNAPTDKLDSLTEQMDADIEERLVQQRVKRNNENEVYIDHRRSNCFDEPRSQGGCDSSYAFATIAFYEWCHCRQTGKFQAYSEQNIIDCSRGHGNSGCDGGNPAKAMMFVHDHIFGLMLRENYPYTGIEGRCPYDETLPSGNMDPRVTFIPLDRLVEHLQHGPIIIILKISQRLLSYTGGVDDNVGHSPQFLHAMLLIGHGRENGKDYWLFRNSLFSSRSDGYYKLNKNVDCFSSGAGIGLSGPIWG